MIYYHIIVLALEKKSQWAGILQKEHIILKKGTFFLKGTLVICSQKIFLNRFV